MRLHVYLPFTGPNAELAYAVLAADQRAGLANVNVTLAFERGRRDEIAGAWATYEEAARVAVELRKELNRRARTCGETPGGRWWDGEVWRKCTLAPGHGILTPHRFMLEGSESLASTGGPAFQLDTRFA